MATVSSTPAQGALTPPSSPGQDSGRWNFAVPLEADHGYTSPHSPSFNVNESYHTPTGTSDQPAQSPQSYGGYQASQRNQQDAYQQRARAIPSYESLDAASGPKPNNLMPPKGANVLGRKGSDISGFGSEPDSLLDLYGRNSADRSQVVSMVEDPRTNGDAHLEHDDPETSHWIHRDKLARIENEELQRAGIYLGRESRSQSRQADRKEKTREHRSVSAKRRDSSARSNRDEKRRRIVSPIAPEAEDLGGWADEDQGLSLQNSAELDAKENTTPQSTVRPPSQKSNHSRIPLFKSSPVPVPTDFVGRNKTRQRNGSGSFSAFDEPGIAYPKSRSRSHSVGSQALLDEIEDPGQRTPTSMGNKTPPVSPKKPVRPAQGTASRKTSHTRVPSAQQKPRSRSIQNRDSPGPRPGTRSGENTPSSAVKRPEGDPPWLATMYKPDPRLPPEQQLLPTVAKRLQQEQWEKEGKVGDVYDRNMDPVHILEQEFAQQRDQPPAPDQRSPPPQEEEKPQPRPPAQWPVRDQSKTTATGRPTGTTANEHSTYKTIPDLQRSPGSGQTTEPKAAPPVQFPEPSQPKKEKSCGCCVVM